MEDLSQINEISVPELPNLKNKSENNPDHPESNDRNPDTQKKLNENPKPPLKKENTSKKVKRDDFEIIGTIGKGSFGEVLLVKKKSNDKQYAMKAIDKQFLFKEKKQYQVYIERAVLMHFLHPNLPRLFYSFQDKDKLFFVMEYLEGGEFSDFLRLNKKLEKKVIQFYAAEIVNILEFLHSNGIAHRDLKPENLMLTTKNHLKIIDFGTAYFFKPETMSKELMEMINAIRKQTDENDDKDNGADKHKPTFVGTAEYVSPELLEGNECSASADLWALGCIIYRMFTNYTPFIDQTEYLIFIKIKKGDYSMNLDIPNDAQELIRSLLKKNPSDRLGAGGLNNDFKALKAHPFFEGIDFENLNEQEAPFFPVISPFKKGKSVEFDNLNIYKQESNEREISPIRNNKNKDGNILYRWLVMKKCGWIFYNPRKIVVKDCKKLEYYDPETNLLKGEINLAKDCKVELVDKTKFTISIPNRKYYFKEIEFPAAELVEKLQNLINNNN